jgi:hypothetical protein
VLDQDEEEDGDEEEEVRAPVDPDSFVFIPKAKAAPQSSSSQSSTPRPKSQFAALAPGTVVHIKVGDISSLQVPEERRWITLLVPVLNGFSDNPVELIYFWFGTAPGQGIPIHELAPTDAPVAQASGGYGICECTRIGGKLAQQETYGVKLHTLRFWFVTSDGGV